MPPEAKRGIASDHFSNDTLEFIRLLNARGVRYVVVGGEAVIFHGYARFTGDVDFFFADDAANVGALYGALQTFWGGRVPEVARAEELAEPGVIVQFGRPPNRIDLMNRIDAVDFAEAWDTRIEAHIESPTGPILLPVLSLKSLLRNKECTARAKDLEDAHYLRGAG